MKARVEQCRPRPCPSLCLRLCFPRHCLLRLLWFIAYFLADFAVLYNSFLPFCFALFLFVSWFVLSTFYFICTSCAANWLGKLHGLKRFLVCSMCLRVCERLCSWFTVCCDLKVLRRSCPRIKLSFYGQSRATKKRKSNRKLMEKHAKRGCALWNRLSKLVKGWWRE